MKLKLLSRATFYLFCSVFIINCSILSQKTSGNMNKNSQLTQTKTFDTESMTSFEKAIAKKFMLSIRYFCEEGVEDSAVEEGLDTKLQNKRCLTPVLTLPASLNDFLSQIELAGVVLFAENIESVSQTQNLTGAIQKAGKKAGSSNYLIGIDQEGGRVVRIPRDIGTSFSGNMAIGATYDQFGDQFANTVGSIIGKELERLGINLNFSPIVDVNNNPDNPVINVRSFGEDPARVSELGLAMMNSLQAQNVMATLKHFPGHGNTNVDSHTGLPNVDLSRELMDQVELAPFKYAIENGDPAMIMTAHIQYPQLDPTEIQNKRGESIIVPATMSHKLMTQILKNELGFKGVVISDAMNMAGISANFELAEATARSFLAGVDISLMPYPVRNQQDLDGFIPFVKKVAKLMKVYSENTLSIEQLEKQTYQSVSVIEKIKLKYTTDENTNNHWVNNQYRKLEQTLANKSISALKLDKEVFPLESDKNELPIHILVRNSDQAEVIRASFLELSEENLKKMPKLSFTFLNEKNQQPLSLQPEIIHLIVFEQAGNVSAVDIGEAGDEIQVPKEKALSNEERKNLIDSYIQLAHKNKIPVTLVAAQSPYDVIPFLNENYNNKINNILVAYDANVYWDNEQNKKVGKGFRAVISAIMGITEVQGHLPVQM